MFKLIFDNVHIGDFDSVCEARKELKKLSSHRIQKFVTCKWDSDRVSGFERGGNERVFDIIKIG